MRKIYITQTGLKEVSPIQAHLVEDDWVLCQLKEDGTPYKFYNADGTPDLIKEQVEAVEQARNSIEAEIVAGLDKEAQKYRYDDIKSARASAGVPLIGDETPEELAIYNEALSLARWDRLVWAESSKLEQKALSGEMAIPSANPEDANYIWNYLPAHGGI